MKSFKYGDFVTITAIGLTGIVQAITSGGATTIRLASGGIDAACQADRLTPATRQEYTSEVLSFTYRAFVLNPSAEHWRAHLAAMLDYQDTTKN